MSSKGKPGRREVFGSKPTPPAPTVAPVQVVVAPPPVAIAEPTQRPTSVVVVQPAEVASVPIVAEQVAESAPATPPRGSGGGLSMTSPFTETATLVSPSPQPEPPKPCRRGHERAKVLVHGLNATGYTLDGEYQTRWRKGDIGEFLKASIDGIYLEAL